MGAWSCPPSPGVQESFACWKLRKWMNMDEEMSQIVPDRPIEIVYGGISTWWAPKSSNNL